MILFRSLLISFLMLIFAGCVKADKTQRDDISESTKSFSLDESLINFNNRAHFEAGNVVLEDIKFGQSKESGEWNMFDNVQVYFKLCGIKDRASQGTIRNEKFNVTSELGNQLIAAKIENKKYDPNPVTVNSGNCLRWSQYIPKFDFLAPSVNIALHFEIESLSGSLGKIVRRVGFNPWDMYRSDNKTSGFFDLTDFDRAQWHSGEWIIGENVSKALTGEMYDSNGQIRFQSLTVEPVEREQQRVAEYNTQLDGLDKEERARRQEIDKLLLQEKNGLHININMFGKPFVWLKDSTGNQQKLEIDRGRFKIYMNLVASGATDDSKKYLLSSNVSQITGQTSSFIWKMNEDGMLNASVPMLLKQRTEFGRMELLVKVKPISPGLRKLKPYTAVLDLGRYDGWVKKQTTSYKFDETFQALDQVQYDKYLQGVSGLDAGVETVRAVDRFYFSPLKMRFVRIMPGESATDRTLQYSVTTCVEHGLYGNQVGRGLQFDIETEDGGRKHKIRRQTNEAGCLTWFGFLSHKYYRKEVLQKKIANVKFVGTNRNRSQWGNVINEYEHDFVYYMNPWDEKWTFGWDDPDMPEGYAEEIAEQRKTAPKSQLFIADFRYETMGFRYSIDKYLNLKVKKAILLKAYPYVLKYNSIVLGRNGTEKLRDGVYLMKIALQKDYLDPAAKGVRIYDKELETPIDLATNEELEGLVQKWEGTREEWLQLPMHEAWAPAFKTSGDLDPRGVEINDQTKNQFSGVKADTKMDLPIDSRGENEDPKEYLDRLKDELRGSKKEYISVQTKLVRVLGGMIITPVEFEVDDLRLMRIRNQVFFQLQTIDEHKLRIATIVDQTVNEMFKDGNIEAKYEQIFTTTEKLEALHEEHKEIEKIIDNYESARIVDEAKKNLATLNISIAEATANLYSIFGLDQFEKGSESFKKRLTEINEKLDRLEQYRYDARDKDNGLSNVAKFRNDKHILINRILRQLDKESRTHMDMAETQVDPEYKGEVDQDPFLKFFFMDTSTPGPDALASIIDYKIKKAREAGDDDLIVDLETLKIADFSESPLTPSFDFEMLTNDGEHNPDLAVDDGKSGLPARTFVGPLTFVFNTNGSSLRPTNILNEEYCTTAFCETPRMIKQGIPPTKVHGAAEVDADGHLPLTSEPVYDSGDSVNADYENNKYYGYLKAYHGMTVDKLINEKRRIEEKNERKMQEGSQIINFTKTMGLKYVLLNDNPESRLKNINHDCAETVDIKSLHSCFTDVRDSSDILGTEKFWNQINKREINYDIDGRKPSIFGNNPLSKVYNSVEGDVTESELESIMEHGWKNENKVTPDVSRKLLHRMCFVLTQNLLKSEYYEFGKKTAKINGAPVDPIGYTEKRAGTIMGKVEKLCHDYVGNVYGYDHKKFWQNAHPQNDDGTPVEIKFSPVVLERKVRAYDTTNRYVYRGGKSLNLNLAASFNISSSNGIKISSTATYKPWDWIKDGVGSIPVVGPALKFIAGGFGISRSNSRDESAGRTEGTNVSSGTFLVSQQATFDIELGEYERCLVARFHPAFMREAVKIINDQNADYSLPPFDSDQALDSQGLLICTGKRLSKCLPVKEKYYYFTQHFTEGDMLDTADLHNHPWLLQLRGYRDFQIFTSMVGAREVKYIDNNEWLNDIVSRTAGDAAALSTKAFNGSQVENKQPELQIIDRSDINWPLDELSRTYFEVLPTFPGLYTFMDERGMEVKEWPYEHTDPGRSFNHCDP